MTPVRWSERSRRDLRRAFDYYKAIDPALARLVIDRIEAKADILTDFPSIGTPIDDELRKLAVDRTPYLIFYQHDAEGVRIVHLRHAAENWRSR